MYKVLLRFTSSLFIIILCLTAAAHFSATHTPGQMIAYTSNRTGNWQVYLIDLRTRMEQQVRVNGFNPATFSWSPDCDHIAFIRTVDRGGSLYTVDLNTQQVELIAQASPDYGYSLPRWSPDGSAILLLKYTTDGTGTDMVVVDVVSKQERQLVQGLRGGVFPSWSPDGERVVFANTKQTTDLYELDVATGTTTRLTYTYTEETSPVYSPDGQRIAYAQPQNGRSNIYTLALSTGTAQRVTADISDAISPTWSPDGRHIAFARGQQVFSTFNVYMLDLLTGEERPMTTHQEWNLFPVWAPCS